MWVFLYLSLVMRADPLTLGIASSAWSAVFVASNFLFGKAVEGGLNRLAALASSLLLCLSVFIVLRSDSVTDVIVAYSVLHAASTSLGRVAANVTLLEYVNYEEWSRYNYFFNYATLIVRGLLLILAYCGALPGTHVLLLSLITSAFYVVTLPPIALPVERTLFRLAKQLDRVHSYMKFTSILPELVGCEVTASRSLELRWETERDLPSYKPLLGALIIVASSDALFILVPKLISGYIGREQTLLVYGLSSLASALALTIISRISESRLVTLVSGLARAFIVPSVLYLTGVGQAVAYLLATAALFNIFNTSNYNAYVNSSAGQRTFLYGVAIELGSAFGSVVGGLLAQYYGLTYVLAFSMLGQVLAAVIASWA